MSTAKEVTFVTTMQTHPDSLVDVDVMGPSLEVLDVFESVSLFIDAIEPEFALSMDASSCW